MKKQELFCRETKKKYNHTKKIWQDVILCDGTGRDWF